MVTEPRDVSRCRDTRNGDGVAARFRPLGSTTEGAADPAPPEFATGPWGYRRAEVDAWASWVAGLVAHGRNETVRADSAEATLRAMLDRLEHLERSAPGTDPGDLPRRTAPGQASPTPTSDGIGQEPAPATGDPVPSGEDRREAARLKVVETTLQEVMRLLHRLVGPEQPGAGRERSPADS